MSKKGKADEAATALATGISARSDPIRSNWDCIKVKRAPVVMLVALMAI